MTPEVVSPTSTVVLLGPQRFEPTVAEAARALGINGRIALVTCGWQEREAEDEDLSAHLGGRTVNLELHRRADDVFSRDPEFAKAYRERSIKLRLLQDFYRVRLESLQETAEVVAHRMGPAELLAEENEISVASLRALDQHHLSRCQEVHREFWANHKREERPIIQEHEAEIEEIVSGCDAVAIAGGHVATILNRWHIFGLTKMLGQRPLLAWLAGAMAVTQRVVLFHDFPPHGVSVPQLLDGGLHLVPDVVALPNPEKRLALGDPERVAMYARRFNSASCLALPRRSWVVWEQGKLSDARGVLRLEPDGSVIPVAEVLA